MFSNKLNIKAINLLVFLLLFYLTVTNFELWWNILEKIIKITIPFLLSFSFAYALNPFKQILVSKGINNKLAVFLIIIIISIILTSILVITLPILYNQLNLFSKYIISSLQHLTNKWNLNLGNISIKLTDFFNQQIKYISNILSHKTLQVVTKSIDFIEQLIIGFIAFIYFLYNIENIKEKVKTNLEKISNLIFKYVKYIDKEIENYIKGLALVMLVQFFEYSILFLIIGHPNWLLLGILASVTSIIPYFGCLTTSLVGMIIATNISIKLLTSTTIICILFPIIDSYLISPKIYGKTNQISPFITIIMISIGGSLFGILGIIMALPIYLLIRTTYLFFYPNIKDKIKELLLH